MGIDWQKVAKEYWDKQPHPMAPELTIAEFPIAVKLATSAKFGGHASPQEATAFMQEFKALNGRLQAQGKESLTPESFKQTLGRLAPVSFALHGRPPTMKEIGQLNDAHPKAVNEYYHHLPDRNYPAVSAGDMVNAITAAKPWANQHIQRDPTKAEAAYLHSSQQDPNAYYDQLRKQAQQNKEAEANVLQATTGGGAGGGGPQAPGGPPAGQ